MKRGFTLFLLGLFLLNVLGYYGVFVGLEISNTKRMQASFDEERHSIAQEVTIKVPLTIPYGTDAKEYTRVDGEFEYQGEFYRLVKQRFKKDTLYIVCVKDSTSKKIHRALTDYVKTFSDKPTAEKGNSKTTPSFIKDYLSTTTELQLQNDGWHKLINESGYLSPYQSAGLSCNTPPPKG